MSEFVIKPRPDWRPRALWFTAALALLGLLFVGYGDALAPTLHQRLFGMRTGNAPLLSELGLCGEDLAMRKRLQALEQLASVDKQAAALLQQELVDAQENIYRLKEDLEFYQGIINTGDSNNGELDAHGIRIQPLVQTRGYRLELVLTRVTKGGKATEGTIDIALEGIQGTASRRLALREISLDKQAAYTFSFRNFQRFENNFILPEDFQPQRVFVYLSVEGREGAGSEKVFDWPLTTNREERNVE